MDIIKKEPQIIFENSFQNVKKFAEILYKCKLCTSLPSILTSEDSFLLHVNNTHLLDNEALKKCPSCKLKFRTKEDLWAHRKLMHSDFASVSEDENSSENDDEYEIAWQITTDHADMNNVDSYLKRKKGRKDKNARRQKKIKNVEEVEQDPHIVIAHGHENTMSPSSANNPENLLKLTNQITADASPTGGHGNNLAPSSTPEFGKYTKLIREGGNIVYFCHVCNWKSQMKVLFTEHCNSSSHLVKVTIAEQNDGCQGDDSKDSSVVEKYGKKGHFMSFLDEKINYYINKRLSNESMTGEQGDGGTQENSTGTNGEGTNDGSTSEDAVIIEVKKEPEEISEDHVEGMELESNTMSGDSNDRSNRHKRKVTSRFKNKEEENEGDWSDDSDAGQQPTTSKVSRQYIEIPKQSEKVDLDSQFKIQVSRSRFSPLRLTSVDKNKSCKSEIDDQSKSIQQNSVVKCEKESPNFVTEEKDNKESEKTQNKESEKPAAENVKQDVSDMSDAISKAVESELYRSSMYMYRCSLCTFVCNDITEYRVHFETEHEPEQTDFPNETSGYMDCKTEQWKVQRIRELLPEILVAHPRGNVSRDLLLQKVSVMVNEPEISNWGPACNKALRELYPDSLAQRKGKFKNYFFGVALIEQVQQEQEASQSTGDGNEVDFSPLRDMTQDMDKILQHLHMIVRWRGDMEAGVSRDDVLHILGRKIDDPEVQHWGVQCNRAIRILFPHVVMKRKGKYKTVYFGVTFSNQVTKEDFASLTAPKPRVPKPSFKDDGIKPKLTWRDAIRTIGGKAFSTQEKKSSVTRGWGPLLNAGPDSKETSPSPVLFPPDFSNPEIIPPNVTTEGLRSGSPSSGTDQSVSSTQNMSLLRYHLTSDEFNVYYKFGADLAKTVWQSKDQLMAAKGENSDKPGDSMLESSAIKQEMMENEAEDDEKSNDADDENSQSTIGDERASPFFTQNSKNANVVETQDGVMYIKQEVESD